MKKPTLSEIENAKKILQQAGVLESLWTKQDIIERAAQREIVLNEEKTLEIMNAISQTHDPERGVNWEFIDEITDKCIQ